MAPWELEPDAVADWTLNRPTLILKLWKTKKPDADLPSQLKASSVGELISVHSLSDWKTVTTSGFTFLGVTPSDLRCCRWCLCSQTNVGWVYIWVCVFIYQPIRRGDRLGFSHFGVDHLLFWIHGTCGSIVSTKITYDTLETNINKKSPRMYFRLMGPIDGH